jgi:murein DD-endopeptidase MepM/ murein hydrolase activator NlpD
MGSDYDAALLAFNMMKVTPLATNPSVDTAGLLARFGADSATPSIWPVHGVVTAGFGQRMDPFTGEAAFHTGIDIASPLGTAVRAAADGIVFQAGPEEGYGNEVLVDHGFGVTTKYAHLGTLRVVAGEKISQDQIIGTVGMTGRTTGPHLHYEVLVRNTPVVAPALRQFYREGRRSYERGWVG